MSRLVLGRKMGERILLDNGVEVFVISIRGEKCRLAISASPEVRIFRDEIAPPEILALFEPGQADQPKVA